jgi:hypothetical protein
MKELLAIIEEEVSIIDPDDYPEESVDLENIRKNLESAMDKIRDQGPAADLTPEEREAIKYALEDVGELYLYTGTSGGFDTNGLTKADVKEHQSRGEKARTQAAALGIYLSR